MDEQTTRRYDERSADRAPYVKAVRKLVQSSNEDFVEALATMRSSDLELMVEKLAFTDADKPDLYRTLTAAHQVVLQCRNQPEAEPQITLARSAINGALKHYVDQESLGRTVNSLGALNMTLQATKTELQHSNDDLYHRAYHDQLTGLKNRAYFMDEMNRVISEADRYRTQREMPVSIVLCDLDGLKIANDGYSHDIGDKYLNEFVKRAKSCLHDRAEDTFARIGGDEFALLLPLTDESGAHIVASRIHQKINETPFAANEVCLPMGVSIGVWQHVPSERPDDALKQADACMYVGKLFRGKNKIVVGKTLIEELKNMPGEFTRMQSTHMFPMPFVRKVSPSK